VPVLQDDTEESLSERILALEHQIYPEAIRLFSEGKITVEGRRVILKGYNAPDTYFTNPPIVP
jgi:phosphoribosylglycinamide formyltransferase-1